MPSEQSLPPTDPPTSVPAAPEPHSTGYLHAVLVDGVRPFRYRSRVRSLLGTPESEEQPLRFAPPLPPVGFKYIHLTESDWPIIAWTSAEETSAAFVAAEEVEPDAEIQRPPAPARPETSAPSDAETADRWPAVGISSRPPAGRRVVPSSPLAEMSVPPASPHPSPDQEALDAAAGQGDVAAGDEPEPTVPPQRPAATSHQAADVEPAHPAQRPVEPTQIEPTHVELPGVSRPYRTDSTFTATGAGTSSARRTQAASGSEYTAPDASPLSRQQTETNQPTSRHPDDKAGPARSLAPNAFTDVRRTQRPPAITPARPEPPSSARLPESLYAQPLPPEEHSANSHSNRETAERIEQLRRTIQQLTAKLSTVSAGEAATDQVPQTKQPTATPPAPPPPLILVQRESDRSQPPRAFWERRYLSRSFLKMLR